MVWDQFQKFLRDSKCKSLSLHRVLLFFRYLFDRGLKPKTILRYRSALVWPLLFFEIDILTKDVARLLSNFGIQRPQKVKLAPVWSIDKVLKLLMSGDYADNDSCSLDNLLSKSIFLYALASGSRVSEMAALSRDPSNLFFWEDDSQVELRPDSKFLYKNQTVDRVPEPVVIPAFQSDDSSQSLCPMRALKAWVTRSGSLKSSSPHLWVNPSSGRPLNRAAISKIFCNLVSKAQNSKTKVNIHQSRAIASSLAFKAGLPIPEILRRAFWKSPDPFFRNYLVNVNCSIPCIVLGKRLH